MRAAARPGDGDEIETETREREKSEDSNSSEQSTAGIEKLRIIFVDFLRPVLYVHYL